MAQNVHGAVAAPDFDVAIVGTMPLVDVIGHLDHPIIEPKSSQLFGAAFVHKGFNLHLHGVLRQPYLRTTATKRNRANWLPTLILIKNFRRFQLSLESVELLLPPIKRHLAHAGLA
jgi:hypothetical protein